MHHRCKSPFGLLAALALLLASALCANAQGTGYWHTGGAQILDAANTPVRIAGVNWYGFETTDMVAHGLTTRDYKAILQSIKDNGYNTIRVPFSNQLIETPAIPTAVQYSSASGPINTDLQGLNSLQILDAIIAEAGQLGLRVILDNHRSEAGNGAEDNGLWYTGSYPESAWITDWTALATRYLGNTTVIGFDLRNEPHNANAGGACWSCGTPTNDWHLAAQRAGNAVLAINPRLLVFVEGTDVIGSDYAFWGGQLAGVATAPVTLNVAGQLVYSPHDYGPVEATQSWLNNDSYTSLATYWDAHWGFIATRGIAPVWVGEFGTPNNDTDARDTASGSQGLWFSSLIQYLAAHPSLSWTYWALNGEDRYGLLPANYAPTPVNALKQGELASLQFALSGGTSPQQPALTLSSAPAVLSAATSLADTGTASAPTVVTYTAAHANNTSTALTDTTILLTLPSAATLLSSTIAGTATPCTQAAALVSCILASVPPGQTGTATLTAVYLGSALDFRSATSVSETTSASARLASSTLTASTAVTVQQANAQAATTLAAAVTPSSSLSYGTPALVKFFLTPAPATSVPLTAFTATLDGSPLTVTSTGTNTWQMALGTLKGGTHQALIQLAATATSSATTLSIPITVSPVAPALNVATPPASLYGQPVALNLTFGGVSGLDPVTGTVTATLDGGAAVKVSVSNSQAAISLHSPINAGSHTVALAYSGDANYAAASQTATQLVNPAALSVTANPATRVFGAANPAFTGTLLGVTAGDGITATYKSAADATTVPGTYATGANAVTPVLNDPQSRLTNYTVTLTPAPFTISPAATITWSNPPAIVYGTPLSAAQLNATSTPALSLVYSPPLGSVLNVGTQTLTVSGTSATVTVPVAATARLLVQQASTSTIISAPPIVTSPYTVTATVTSAQGGAVSGPVNFFDGGALIGSGALDAKGTASFVIPSLSSGQHSFTATFPGDPNNLLSTSTAAIVAGAAGSFTLAAAPASLTVKVGGTGSTSLTIAPKGGISGGVKLTCTGLPAGALCTFAPALLQLDGSASTLNTTVSITLPASTTGDVRELHVAARITLACLPCVVLLTGLTGRRRGLRLLSLLLALLALPACLGLSGCQATSSAALPSSGSFLGSYNATVTAVAGTVTQTAIITVNVTQ